MLLTQRLQKTIAFALMLLLSVVVSAEISPPESLTPLYRELAGARLSKTDSVIVKLEKAGGEAMLPLFSTMLEGRLYYYKAQLKNSIKQDSADDNGQPLSFDLLDVRRNADGKYLAKDVFTQETLREVEGSAIKKIRVNNKLRSVLRDVIARLQLDASSSEVRLQAVTTMMGDLNAHSAALLQTRWEKESDVGVKHALEQALALYRLRTTDDATIKITAIRSLSENLDPQVRHELQRLMQQDRDGNYLEADAEVRHAATKAVAKLDDRISFYQLVEQLFFGLSLGSILLLAAIGLAITFGVMGVINMAHGEMIMLGAYTTYVVQLLMPNALEYSILVAVPAAFVVSGLVGVAIERGVIQFLHGRPLETLLATFGISLILQQAVRTIFSPLNRQVATPEWMSGSLEINPLLSLTYNRLYIFIFALLVFFILQLILKKTSLGLNVRAVSQNRQMAKAMGIRTEWVDAMTFGLGSGIAGVAGVALSQLTNVGPNLGQAYIIDSFMVVVFGGVGNLLGTLVGGFSLGIVNKFLEPSLGPVLANICILVAIILFIQKRPKGLFPQKGRAAND